MDKGKNGCIIAKSVLRAVTGNGTSERSPDSCHHDQHVRCNIHAHKPMKH